MSDLPQATLANKNKRLRASGKSYQYKERKTNQWRTNEGRSIGPDCTCNRQYSKLIGEEGIKAIYSAHYDLKKYNLQTSDLVNKIH